MEQTTDNNKAQAVLMISNINKVEGFDPSVLAVDYQDPSGQTYKRLPAMAQIAWFRMKYPEGKIAFSNIIEKLLPTGELVYMVTARVYTDYRMDINCFLAEGTATRGYCKDKPSVSPKEWAQTAAIGIALRNAGFGLQFNIAGEDFPAEAPNELGGTVIGSQNIPSGFSDVGMANPVSQPMTAPIQAGFVPPADMTPNMNGSLIQNAGQDMNGNPNIGQNIQQPIEADNGNNAGYVVQQTNVYNTVQGAQQVSEEKVGQVSMASQNSAGQHEMTYEEKLNAAMNMQCPINKYKGQTLGQVLMTDPAAINWIATKSTLDDNVKTAATLICEYALNEKASA